jgi:hypothetical protein
MRQINLFLGAFWLLLAVGITLRPDLLPPQFEPFHVQMAVFAVVMFFYNAMRWWLFRLQRRYLQEADEPLRRRRHHAESVDPTFDLSDDGPSKPPD